MSNEDKVTISQMMESVPSNWPWPLVKSCLIKLDKRTSLYTPSNVSNTQEQISGEEGLPILSPSSPLSEYHLVNKHHNGLFWRSFNEDSFVSVMVLADETDNLTSYQIELTNHVDRRGLIVGGGLIVGVAEFPTVQTLCVKSGTTIVVRVEDPINTSVRMASMPLHQ